MRHFLMIAAAVALLSCPGLARADQTPAAGTTQAAPATAPAAKTKTKAPIAGQFATEAEAKSHCPADDVVWANNKSKIYHAAGTKGYGTTKKGAYMCRKDADAAGFRAPKPRHAATPPKT